MIKFLRFGKFVLNKALSPIGIEIRRVQIENLDTSLYKEQARPEIPRYVNIGGGGFYHPFWHNLDNPNDYYSDTQKDKLNIQYDLTSHEPLPFQDNTLQVAYTSHVIEHLHDDDVKYLFSEIYRCLQPGGYFRVTCPDMDLEYDAYSRKDADFWKWTNAYGIYNTSIEQKFLDHFATALTETHPIKDCKKFTSQEVKAIFAELPKEEAFNFLISQIPPEIQKDFTGDHINWFNSNKIIKMLRQVNFFEIYDSKFGQSKCSILRDKSLFDSTCPELSLYIECRK